MIPALTPSTHKRYKWVITYSDPTVYVGRRPKRKYHYFTEKAVAEKKLREMKATVLAGGIQALDLSPAARVDALNARALLAVDYPRMTLTDVVRDWLNTRGAGPANRTKVEPLFETFLHQKTHSEGATRATRANLEARVKAWVVRERITTLGDITREACLALRDRHGPEAATRKNDMNAVSSFLSWLTQEGHIPFNPLRGQRRPKVVREAPEIYTPDQVRRLLLAAASYKAGRFARFMGLLFLAGLRPSEVPLSKIDLDHEQPAARVQGGKLRGRANRITQFTPAGAEWMRRRPEGIHEPTTGQRRQICKLAGVEWIQDGARHTWISARVALTNDEKLVAREAGTSPDTIFKHYLRIMTKADAEALEQIVANLVAPKKQRSIKKVEPVLPPALSATA